MTSCSWKSAGCGEGSIRNTLGKLVGFTAAESLHNSSCSFSPGRMPTKRIFMSCPGRKSRHLDQAPRQSRDLHRVSHVEHVDLPVRTKSGGLQHKLHRRRDGHEVARHIFMRDRHRTTGGDLAEKDRRHASAAAHHVTEPHARAPRYTSPF